MEHLWFHPFNEEKHIGIEKGREPSLHSKYTSAHISKTPKVQQGGSFQHICDQCIDNSICVDKEIQPNVLVEIISMDEEKLPLESDAYLERLLIKELNDVDDNDVAEVDSLSEMDSGIHINYVVHCSMFFEFSISYLQMPLGKLWM